MSDKPDDFMKNFGMMIPLEPTKLEEYKEDPNGVPIYAECPANGDLCACTGACRKIIGYNTDPEKIQAYKAAIVSQNQLLKEYRERLFNNKWTDNPNGSKTWEF